MKCSVSGLEVLILVWSSNFVVANTVEESNQVILFSLFHSSYLLLLVIFQRLLAPYILTAQEQAQFYS
jgi:hypothetical protein